jgi:hypothetical protein
MFKKAMPLVIWKQPPVCQQHTLTDMLVTAAASSTLLWWGHAADHAGLSVALLNQTSFPFPSLALTQPTVWERWPGHLASSVSLLQQLATAVASAAVHLLLERMKKTKLSTVQSRCVMVCSTFQYL